jgi:hypothetical protein
MLTSNKQAATSQILVDSAQKRNQTYFLLVVDQSRFMEVVNNTQFYDHSSRYRNSIISGTSWSCSNVRTYDHRKSKLETKYASTFDNIRYNNLETAEV